MSTASDTLKLQPLSVARNVAEWRQHRTEQQVNQQVTLEDIHAKAVNAFSDPARLADWKSKDWNDAYSDVAGAGRLLVNLAQDLVRDGGTSNRYAANALEHALDPKRIQQWLATVDLKVDPAALKDQAKTFLQDGLADYAQQARHRMGGP